MLPLVISDPSAHPMLVANPHLAELLLLLPFLSPDEKIEQRYMAQ